MNKFELFCMIFFVLDDYWDEHKSDELSAYLSDANPFLFDDLCSAEPSIYNDFCSKISENVTEKNSYSLALNYVHSLNIPIVTKAFEALSEDEWNESLTDYLSSQHKGETGVVDG